jgi:hypothetical protein
MRGTSPAPTFGKKLYVIETAKRKSRDCIPERRKNLDRFDALRVKGVYASKREQGEREH